MTLSNATRKSCCSDGPALPLAPGIDETVHASSAIDAVVLWVDGNDPAHRAKLERYLAQFGHRHVEARATRFRSVGEVDFCISSIMRFAPFIRRVHVVTDDQAGPLRALSRRWPEAWRAKLALIDHRDIFAGHEQHVPTFNSLAIESLMHRIPGLEEQFVYFNDDFVLIKPVAATAFFDGGRPVLHGRRMSMPDARLDRRLRRLWRALVKPPPGALRASNTQAQALGARLAGADGRFLLASHSPYPLRRSTLQGYFDSHSQVLERNLSYRLRDLNQFAPTSLANHLELQRGHAVVAEDENCLYLKPASDRHTLSRIAAAEHDEHLVCACVQSLDEADAGMREQVLAWLSQVVSRGQATA